MAKYFNSSWGTIVGKLGDAVGKYYHGKRIVFAYRKQRNFKTSLDSLKQIKAGTMEQTEINQKLMNGRFIFKLLIELSKLNYESLIFPTFSKIAKSKNKIPFNVFVSSNSKKLLNSIPDAHKLCDENNCPDMSALEFTPEYSGPPIPMKANYNPVTGSLQINWENPPYLKQDASESCLVAVYFIPKHIVNWTKHSKPWNALKIWGSASTALAKIEDRTTAIKIDENLNPEFLTAHLFFKNPYSQFSKTYSVKPT